MTGLHISSPQEDSVKEPPCGLCYKFFDDGPLPPCFLLSLIGSIQESHDLRSCAVVAGTEQTAADAAGDLVLLRPCDCISVVGICRHIVERAASADGGAAGGAVEEGYSLFTGAGSIGAELAVAGAAGNASTAQATALA